MVELDLLDLVLVLPLNILKEKNKYAKRHW